ncbi:hypothetical protein PG993_000598 [Apiospora rasikravindrae]|uniref:Uncharacterized protein n=1 Tax=Apiospora rasikravindrae TaxID=990691 RepID=A0ABR1UB38_9PEZI
MEIKEPRARTSKSSNDQQCAVEVQRWDDGNAFGGKMGKSATAGNHHLHAIGRKRCPNFRNRSKHAVPISSCIIIVIQIKKYPGPTGLASSFGFMGGWLERKARFRGGLEEKLPVLQQNGKIRLASHVLSLPGTSYSWRSNFYLQSRHQKQPEQGAPATSAMGYMLHSLIDKGLIPVNDRDSSSNFPISGLILVLARRFA